MVEVKQLRKLMRLSDVPRWTVVPTIKQQSVAEHVLGVVAMTMWMDDYLSNAPDPDVTLVAILHDVEEAVTGDLPSPTKDCNGLRAMSPTALYVKMADCMEALWFLDRERQMGNSALSEISKWVKDKRLVPIYSAYFNESSYESQRGVDVMVADMLHAFDIAIHPGMEHMNEI